MNVGTCMSISPNWSDAFRLKHIFKTGIQTTTAGTEKRGGYRSRGFLAAGWTIDNMSLAERNWLVRNLFLYQHWAWYIPIWSDAAQLAQASAADHLHLVDAANKHFGFTNYIVLVKDYATFSVCTIDHVNANTIYISTPPSGAWAAGSWIYPCFVGLLGQKSSLKSYTSQMQNYAVDAEEVFPHIPAEYRPESGG